MIRYPAPSRGIFATNCVDAIIMKETQYLLVATPEHLRCQLVEGRAEFVLFENIGMVLKAPAREPSQGPCEEY